MFFDQILPNSAFDLLGETKIPGWQSRLKEAAYTSPNNNRQTFLYVDLKRTINKRTTDFQFNGINGKFIQDRGHDGGEFPLACYFSGEDHDQLATNFESILIESGRGVLEHPLYGTFDVVPVGSIQRTNAMVTGANESIVSVTFSTTLADAYPLPTFSTRNAIDRVLKNFDIASAAEFDSALPLKGATGQSQLLSTVTDAVAIAGQTIGKLSESTAEQRRAFEDQQRLINNSLDTLVGQPLNLAQQLVNLIKSPAIAATSFTSRIAGYAAFAERLFGKPLRYPNDLYVNNLLTLAAVNASVLAANTTTFSNRREAQEAARNMIALNEAVNSYNDNNFADAEFPNVDEGGAYQSNQNAVAGSSGQLVEQSFDLRVERIVTLERERSPVDVCAQYVKSLTDEALQTFLDNNLIGGDEMFLLPRGRRIVYYE